MIIEFKNTTVAGANLRTEMFFNGIRVAEMHCTPREFRDFTESLYNPINPVEVRMDETAEDVT